MQSDLTATADLRNSSNFGYSSIHPASQPIRWSTHSIRTSPSSHVSDPPCYRPSRQGTASPKQGTFHALLNRAIIAISLPIDRQFARQSTHPPGAHRLYIVGEISPTPRATHIAPRTALIVITIDYCQSTASSCVLLKLKSKLELRGLPTASVVDCGNARLGVPCLCAQRHI